MKATVHVFKTVYSVKTLHFGGEDYCEFCSYSYKEALKKQIELILNYIRNKDLKNGPTLKTQPLR